MVLVLLTNRIMDPAADDPAAAAAGPAANDPTTNDPVPLLLPITLPLSQCCWSNHAALFAVGAKYAMHT